VYEPCIRFINDVLHVNIYLHLHLHAQETLTGRRHDTSVQQATSDNENVEAV